MADNFLWREFNQTFVKGGNMVRQLIVVNVIVFLILRLIDLVFFISASPSPIGIVLDYLAIPADIHSLLHKPWTFITYSFTHFEFMHILFNMLWLYWMGSLVTEFLGNKRVLPIYLMGSWFGAVLFVLAYQFLPVFQPYTNDATAIGASAGVLALVVAAATLLPDYTIMLFIWPIRLKWIAVVSIALDFIGITEGNAGGHIAHLGGALFGFLFIKQLQRGNDWSRWMNNVIDSTPNFFSGKPKLRVTYSKGAGNVTGTKKIENRQQEKLDAILDKISKSGYESLSKEEKEFLFKTSRDEK